MKKQTGLGKGQGRFRSKGYPGTENVPFPLKVQERSQGGVSYRSAGVGSGEEQVIVTEEPRESR